MSISSHAGRTLSVLVALSLGGCFSTSYNPEYPQQWPQRSAERVGDCPLVAGRYQNLGTPSLLAGIDCSLAEGPVPPGDASLCTPWLAQNFGVWRQARVVTLSQPDGDILQVSLDDSGPAAPGTRIFHRGSDFRCDGEGLHFHKAQSALDPGAPTVVGAMLLTGGRVATRRTFARDREGGLTMTMRRHAAVIMFLVIGGKRTATSHVRWQPEQPGVSQP